MYILFFLGVLGLLLGSCNFIKGFKQDGLAEEIVEDVIKANTGLDVDLTPGSPEK